ncbi:hypothetical protein BC830DRAFT_1158494 [Chytriomyces sp. MP71]|nr:hypothetical protein BC830DRAFT_1158494 [Chytriomyces sp. MP71]
MTISFVRQSQTQALASMRPSINLRRWLKTAPWPFSLLPASIPLPSLLWILLLVVANIALFSHLRGNAPWQNKSTSIKTVGRSQPAHRPACVQIIKTDKFQINSCVRTGKHTLLISRVDRRECVASLEKRTSMDAELETRNKKRIGPVSCCFLQGLMGLTQTRRTPIMSFWMALNASFQPRVTFRIA